MDVVVGGLRDDGRRLEQLKQVTSNDSSNYVTWWTPDGKLLFSSDRTRGKNQIYQQRPGQEAAETLISSPDVTGAKLTRDGAWILYWATANTNQTLMRAPATGGTSERILELPAKAVANFDCPTRANGSCVLGRIDNDQLIFYSLDPTRGQGRELARTKVSDPFGSMAWALAQDATKIAFSNYSDRVRIIDLQRGLKHDLRIPGMTSMDGLCWSNDGAAVYQVARTPHGFNLLRLDLSGKSQVLLTRPFGEIIYSPVASPDGRYLAFSQQVTESNAYLLENF